jgi:hypothetical protein
MAAERPIASVDPLGGRRLVGDLMSALPSRWRPALGGPDHAAARERTTGGSEDAVDCEQDQHHRHAAARDHRAGQGDEDRRLNEAGACQHPPGRRALKPRQ